MITVPPMGKMRGQPADTDDSLGDGVWTPARAMPSIALMQTTHPPAWLGFYLGHLNYTSLKGLYT